MEDVPMFASAAHLLLCQRKWGGLRVTCKPWVCVQVFRLRLHASESGENSKNKKKREQRMYLRHLCIPHPCKWVDPHLPVGASSHIFLHLCDRLGWDGGSKK